MKQITDEKFIDKLEAWLRRTVGKTWDFRFEGSDGDAGNVGLSISMQVWGLKCDALLDYDGEIQGGA